AYQQSLEQLAAGEPVEPILRRFEWQLLELLGYGFSLTEDAHGQPLDRDRDYAWYAGEGLRPLDDPLPGAIGLSGAALLAMAAGDWSAPATLRAAKQLMRQALSVHLGDRPLVSRSLFRRQTPSITGEQQDGITVHLREDRRHIQERDIRLLAEVLQTRMNLEMAITDEMLAFAGEIRPAHVCLVPERREELTTEGGLDVAGNLARVQQAVEQ